MEAELGKEARGRPGSPGQASELADGAGEGSESASNRRGLQRSWDFACSQWDVHEVC